MVDEAWWENFTLRSAMSLAKLRPRRVDSWWVHRRIFRNRNLLFSMGKMDHLENLFIVVGALLFKSPKMIQKYTEVI